MTVYYGTIPEDPPEPGIFQPKTFGTPALECAWVATTSTNIRGTFSAPVRLNQALLCADLYVITPVDEDDRTPIAHAVTPEDVDEPTYVDVTVDECRQGADYNVEIQLVERAED
jgi:hypothetical protein